MSVDYLGSLTIGNSVPLAAALNANLDASLALVLPSLNARVAGLVQLSINLGITAPSIVASLDVATKLLASLTSSVSLGLPGVNFQVAAIANLLAQLELDLGALNVSAAFSVSAALTLGTAGCHAWAAVSTSAAIGGEIDDALAGGVPGADPSDSAFGWFFVGTLPSAITGMQATFP